MPQTETLSTRGQDDCWHFEAGCDVPRDGVDGYDCRSVSDRCDKLLPGQLTCQILDGYLFT